MSEYTWHGWLQYNGEEVSIYQHLEFPISEELYQKIQEEKQAKVKSGEVKRIKQLQDILPDEVPFELLHINWVYRIMFAR